MFASPSGRRSAEASNAFWKVVLESRLNKSCGRSRSSVSSTIKSSTRRI